MAYSTNKKSDKFERKQDFFSKEGRTTFYSPVSSYKLKEELAFCKEKYHKNKRFKFLSIANATPERKKQSLKKQSKSPAKKHNTKNGMAANKVKIEST